MRFSENQRAADDAAFYETDIWEAAQGATWLELRRPAVSGRLISVDIRCEGSTGRNAAHTPCWDRASGQEADPPEDSRDVAA